MRKKSRNLHSTYPINYAAQIHSKEFGSIRVASLNIINHNLTFIAFICRQPPTLLTTPRPYFRHFSLHIAAQNTASTGPCGRDLPLDEDAAAIGAAISLCVANTGSPRFTAGGIHLSVVDPVHSSVAQLVQVYRAAKKAETTHEAPSAGIFSPEGERSGVDRLLQGLMIGGVGP